MKVPQILPRRSRGLAIGLAVALIMAFVSLGLVSGAVFPGGASPAQQVTDGLLAETPGATPIALTPEQQHCLQPRGGEAFLRKLPPEKQQLILRSIQVCVDSLHVPEPPSHSHPALLTPRQPAPTPHTALPHRAAGSGIIVETRQAPVPGPLFLGENQWYETKGNETIAVYAGKDRQDPSQGMIVVVVTEAKNPVGSPTASPRATYLTPTKEGSVHITDADGEHLSLRSTSGTTFIFDVASRKFLPVPGR